MCSTELIGTGSEDHPSSTTSSASSPVISSVNVDALNNIPNSASNLKMADTTNKNPNPNRRSNKPIMEKKRRARINNCLNELKSILLEAMRKDPARHSKLEKADILELTVAHLKSLHRATASNNVEAVSKFRAGFTECINEVGRFLSGSSSGAKCDEMIQTRLLNHLADCLGSCSMSMSMNQHNSTSAFLSSANVSSSGLFSLKMDDYLVEPNNNVLSSRSHQQHPNLNLINSTSSSVRVSHGSSSAPAAGGGSGISLQQQPTPIISLVQSRLLPSGEFAFVVPGFNSSTIQVMSVGNSTNGNGNNVSMTSPLSFSVANTQSHFPAQRRTIPNPMQMQLSPEVPLELTVSPPTTMSPAVAHQSTSISPAYPGSGGGSATSSSGSVHSSYQKVRFDFLRQRYPSGTGTARELGVSGTQFQPPPMAHIRESFMEQDDMTMSDQPQQPLALVTQKREDTDMSCWRPW